jgi:hypothetical protein
MDLRRKGGKGEGGAHMRSGRRAGRGPRSRPGAASASPWTGRTPSILVRLAAPGEEHNLPPARPITHHRRLRPLHRSAEPLRRWAGGLGSAGSARDSGGQGRRAGSAGGRMESRTESRRSGAAQRAGVVRCGGSRLPWESRARTPSLRT